MHQRLITAIVSALLLLALSIPALAKEGAVTKLDPGTPTEWHASQTYALGYTIRMDGVEPYKADRTEIVANSLDGKTSLIFPGVGDATAGHYTAQVTFPSAGTYSWKVTQGSFFAPFELGTLSVLPALASSGASGGTSAPSSDPVRDAIPFAAVGTVLFATFVLARNQRRRIVRTA